MLQLTVLALFGISCCAWAAQEDDLAPAPEGYPVHLEGDTSPQDVEQFRLDLIIKKKRGATFSTKVIQDMKQQLTHMFHLDDGTRNAAFRCMVFDIPNDPDFASAYRSALLDYSQEIERLRLENQILSEQKVDPTNTPVRDQVLEFAMFELTVLRPHSIPLDEPAGALLKRWAQPEMKNDSEQFLDQCMEFLLRKTTTNRVRQYVGLCMALTPGASQRLHAYSQIVPEIARSTRSTARLPEYFEACAAVSTSLGNRPENALPEVMALAMASQPACRDVLNVYFKTRGERARLSESDLAIFKKTVDLLEAKKELNKEQGELLEQLKHRLSPKYVDGIPDNDVQSTANSRGNIYFGF
jgi:hypothetical protein